MNSRPGSMVPDVDHMPRADAQGLEARVRSLEAELGAERQARAQAEHALSLKDEFLSVVAHELRSPLGAILGWAHMLRRRGSEEEFERGLEVIEQCVQAQAKLIESLLDMSRMTSNRIRLNLEVLEPRAFIDAAVEAIRATAAEKELRIRKVLDVLPSRVRGDATRLQQVTGNLLANAVKFTPEKGSIEVALRASDGFAVMSVTDTGAGIAPEFLPQVFDRFRQLPSTPRGHGGLGLGLAIARHVVELHGGDISAHSEGEGRGATFTVRLPLAT